MNSTHGTPPTSLDRFFVRYQYPILMTTFGCQVLHHQYIQRTTASFEAAKGSIKSSPIPRPLKAGLVWAAVFAGLLTKITLSQKTINDYKDPIVALAGEKKKMWKKEIETETPRESYL